MSVHQNLAKTREPAQTLSESTSATAPADGLESTVPRILMSAPITQPFATMESAEIVTDPMSVGAGLDIQEITATMSSMSASRTLARMMEPATTWSMITLVLVFQDLMVSFDQLCLYLWQSHQHILINPQYWPSPVLNTK